MKNNLKLIALAMLVAPIIAGCDKPAPGYIETRTEQEIVEELADASLLDVGVGYNKFSSEGVNFGETELTVNINQKVWEGDKAGLNFEFTYQVIPQESYTTEFLKLTDKEGVPTLEADIVTPLDIDSYPQAKVLGAALYILRAEITFTGYAEGFKAPSGLKITTDFVGQKISNKSWNALVKTTQSGKISEVKSAKSGDLVITYGRVTGAYQWTSDQLYSGLWITDGTDGLMLYAGTITEDFFDESGALAINVGDVVRIYGEAAPYNGLFEIKPKSAVKVTDQSIIDTIAPASYPTITGAELKAMTVVDTGNIVKMSGLRLNSLDGSKTVNPSSLNPGSHWTLNCNDGTTDVTIYVNYHMGNDAQTAVKNFLSSLTSGQTFSLTAAVSSYNAMQLNPLCVGNASVASSFTLDVA